MRLLKRNTLLGLVNSYVVDSPQPSNLSYAWNGGSLLATCLGIQIVTGVILAMHYTPNVDLAFVSVEHKYFSFFPHLSPIFFWKKNKE
jgi:ubiquinol-cytochrome c reductase cytochrome b subunit